MSKLTLSDLVNPEKVQSIMLNSGTVIELSSNQGFQVLDKTIELWEELEDGRLLRLKRWIRSRSILSLYTQ